MNNNNDELEKFQDRFFIKDVTNQNKLETSLISLTIIARLISLRDDLK